MSNKTFWWVVVGLVVLVLVIWRCDTNASDECLNPQKAMNFTMLDSNFEKVEFSKFVGEKPVVLAFCLWKG
ncbi:hypothetical protein ACFL1O_00280 [Patescibacteria group bacterium]